MRSARAVLALLLLAPLAPAVRADVITLADGSEISGVKVRAETLTSVDYTKDGKEKSVESAKVQRVQYKDLPPLLDEAETALKGGDVLSAIDLVDRVVEDPPRQGKWAWAQTYAGWEGIRIRLRAGDLPAVADKAGAFVQMFPDSRYLPLAFLAKASAERQLGKTADAETTLKAFRAVIDSKGLSKKWDLECRLGEARVAGGSLDAQRKSLEGLAKEAQTDYPTVANRARVALGEALLAEAERNVATPAKARALRKEAQGVFEEIVDDPSADDETLAGAHTGLGECLFYAGADSKDPAVLEQAVLHLLRVPILYEDESAYVPKALFLAGRAFDLMQDRDRKRDMRRELERRYPQSPWTEQAKKILG